MDLFYNRFMVKRVLIILILIFLLIFCTLVFLFDESRDVTLSCSKRENICTKSSSTYIFKRKSVETIQFDKIIMSRIIQNVSTKLEDPTRYANSPTTYYYYDWNVYYKNNGTVEKLPVFRTSKYDSSPAYEELDKEYRYYLDTTKLFNSFLNDKSKYSLYIPEYPDNSAKERDFWMERFILSIILTQVIFYTYLIILFAVGGLESLLPEGKIKKILARINSILLKPIDVE